MSFSNLVISRMVSIGMYLLNFYPQKWMQCCHMGAAWADQSQTGIAFCIPGNECCGSRPGGQEGSGADVQMTRSMDGDEIINQSSKHDRAR